MSRGGDLALLPVEILVKEIVQRELDWEARAALGRTCRYMEAVVAMAWEGTGVEIPQPLHLLRLLPDSPEAVSETLRSLAPLGVHISALDLSSPLHFRPDLSRPHPQLKALTLPAAEIQSLDFGNFPALQSLSITQSPAETEQLAAALSNLPLLRSLKLIIPRGMEVKDLRGLLPASLTSLSLNFRSRLSLLPLWMESKPSLPNLRSLTLHSTRPLDDQHPLRLHSVHSLFPHLHTLHLNGVLLWPVKMLELGRLREVGWADGGSLRSLLVGVKPSHLRSLHLQMRSEEEEEVVAELSCIAWLPQLSQLCLALQWRLLCRYSKGMKELQKSLSHLRGLERLGVEALGWASTGCAAIGGGGAVHGVVEAVQELTRLVELRLQLLPGPRDFGAAAEKLAWMMGSWDRPPCLPLRLCLPREKDAQRLVSLIRARVPSQRHLVSARWLRSAPPRPKPPSKSFRAVINGRCYLPG